LSLFFETVVNVFVRRSKSFASFATFVTFSLLSERTMLYFFPKGLLLLLFDNLLTAPQRLSVKLTTVAATP